jgi:hypothetical protein
MPVGDRKDDEDQAQRNQHHGREEFSHDHLLASMENRQPRIPQAGEQLSRLQ